jgi:DNA phosphorothioation-dependent restriction protein DptH
MPLPSNATPFLTSAFKKLLGRATPGSMAFVRCLPPEAVSSLAAEPRFDLSPWKVAAVTDQFDSTGRQITADVAVEWREDKSDPVLLIVDMDKAGAGMDGIYSAARELTEGVLFDTCIRLANDRLPHGCKRFAEAARKKARRAARNQSLSPWQEFAYLCRATAGQHVLGSALPEIGLWPIDTDVQLEESDLDRSLRLVERLLPRQGNRLSPDARVAALQLSSMQSNDARDLVKFLGEAESRSSLEALRLLEAKENLWINRLKPGVFETQSLLGIGWVPWRGKAGKLLSWPGLIENGDERLELHLRSANTNGDDPKTRARLEVRWKSNPVELPKGAVDYQIEIRSGADVLAEKAVSHSIKPEQSCVFVQEDFVELDENSRFEAQVVIRALSGDGGEAEDSPYRAVTEEFVVCFGDHEPTTRNSVGSVFPTLALAALHIAPDAEAFDNISRSINSAQVFSRDRRGFIICRYNGKSARVLCPDLLLHLARDWTAQGGMPGRWRMRVRADGTAAAVPEFLKSNLGGDPASERFLQVSGAFARWLAQSSVGPLAVLYSDQKPVTDYVNAATTCWEASAPDLALIHTLEVVSVTDQRIGLIVLPTHPLRIAWQQGFDMLAYHHCYEGNVKPSRVAKLLSGLSGSQYPAMLPGIDRSPCFVYADSLGFHAVAMTHVDDEEPKATVALLSRLLSQGDAQNEEWTAPSVGKNAADLLGDEIASYVTLHPDTRRIAIHALRPGDGMSVARALGSALDRVERSDNLEEETTNELEKRAFQLDLYPAEAGRHPCGHFLSATAARRRSGAGSVPEVDRWMLESVRRPGDVTQPRLSWARRMFSVPETPAHIAIAFDFLSSRLEHRSVEDVRKGLLEVHGLALTPERWFEAKPIPRWISVVPTAPEGEKHPSNRVYSDRLVKAHACLMKLVALDLGGGPNDWPAMVTEVNPDQEDALARLHRLCDWVVSVDRHAGVEYFDSPRDLPRPYDAYLIDCVPERDDLGFLQLITSTSSLDEIRQLLDAALGEMGLSTSPKNCDLLLSALKSLSGRLALRLTTAGSTIPELVALAMVQNQCARAHEGSITFPSLNSGFFVPLDDVPELLCAVGESRRQTVQRADLLYVTSASKRGGLLFRLVEVKFRRYLKTARSSDVTDAITQQLDASNKQWDGLYGRTTGPLEKTIQRARLARVLRFYLRKARRHQLSRESADRLGIEIDRLCKDAASYELPSIGEQDNHNLGFVLCPEYTGEEATRISVDGDSEIWLFGPGALQMPTKTLVHEELPSELAAVQVADESGLQRAELPKTAEPTAVLSGDAVKSPSAANIILGQQMSNQEDVVWRVSTQGNPHLLIVGLPGMGKTTCLIHLCRQLVMAGIAPVVFSYHEDIDEKLSALLPGRLKSVNYAGLGFNPLQVVGQGPLAYMDNVAMLRDIFSTIFPDLGDVQLGRIREALKRSYSDGGWSTTSSGRIPEFGAFFEILRADAKPDKGVMLRLNELADYGFFAATSGSASLLDSDEPAIVKIHGTQNEVLQRAFASFVLHNLYQAMFRRGPQSQITHAIVFDEAHRAAKLKLIPTMAKECRKFGLALVVASQEVKDFDDSLFTAVASYLSLRVNESDAKKMARVMAPSDKIALYADRIKQTEKYRAWYLTEGMKSPVSTKLSTVN